MKITAVIPIRKGSQRVKDKNLRPFGDTSLMELKLSSLLKVPELDAIVVNTNSDEAIEITKRYMGGVKFRFTEEKSITPLLNVREVNSSVIWAK